MFKKNYYFRLIQFSKNTEFGEHYNFSSINTYKDFASKVPIQQYESIEPLIERCRKGEQNLFWANQKLNGLQNLVEQPMLKVNLFQ